MGEQEFNSILQGVMGMDSCTCGQLRKAARTVTLLYDNAFKSSGLLSTQLGVLHAICKSESIKISDLANRLIWTEQRLPGISQFLRDRDLSKYLLAKITEQGL